MALLNQADKIYLGGNLASKVYAGAEQVWPPPVVYEVESEAIFAGFTVPPTEKRKGRINDCVLALKTGNVWTKLDVLEVQAAADSQAALVNWKNPSLYNGTLVNAPAFTVDRGFAGASTKYIDTNFNSTTAATPNYTQNSACVFGWSLTNTNTTNTGMVGLPSVATMQMAPRAGGNLGVYQVNSTGSSTIGSQTDGTGFYVANRSASNAIQFYKNGTSIASTTTASTAPTNDNINFLRRTTGYWIGTMAVGGIGGSLNATEQTAFYNALSAYLAGIAIDAIVASFTTPPTTARELAISTCVSALVTDGVWDKLDTLYLHAAADSQAGLINWKLPGTYNATAINAPVFTVDRGFTGGSTKYLSTGFTLNSAGGSYVQNASSLFAWSNSSGGFDNGLIGAGTSYCILNGRTLTDTTGVRVNNGTTLAAASTDGSGLWSATRPNTAATIDLYRNGAAHTVGHTASSSALLAVDMEIMKVSTTYWGGQISCAGWGAALTAAEHTMLYNALRAYMTTVGVP